MRGGKAGWLAIFALHIVPAGSTLNAQAHSVSAGRPFVTWQDTLIRRGGMVIWTRNNGPDTVLIATVHLDHCLNIRVGCGTTALGIRLAPGDSAPALTVRPGTGDDRYGYQLSWEWRIVAAEPATTGGLPFDAWSSNLPDGGGVRLWVRNTDTNTLTMTGVHLTNCSNIALGCGTTTLSLRLAPGDSAAVLTIKPDALDQPAGYQVSWDWLRRSS